MSTLNIFALTLSAVSLILSTAVILRTYQREKVRAKQDQERAEIAQMLRDFSKTRPKWMDE